MNLILFFVILIVSFVAVRIGAIAFHLTGLDWSLSKFQALSCFTGTGFTTRESELITGHIRRRQIASILMVLGNAGLVTLIATFANSLRPGSDGTSLQFFGIHLPIPSAYQHWFNLLLIIVVLAVLYRVFTKSRLTRRFNVAIKQKLTTLFDRKTMSFEELTIATGGYGVIRVSVCPESALAGKTLMDSGLKARGVIVLALVRENQTIPNPPADSKILSDDELICFGKLLVLE